MTSVESKTKLVDCVTGLAVGVAKSMAHHAAISPIKRVVISQSHS